MKPEYYYYMILDLVHEYDKVKNNFATFEDFLADLYEPKEVKEKEKSYIIDKDGNKHEAIEEF